MENRSIGEIFKDVIKDVYECEKNDGNVLTLANIIDCTNNYLKYNQTKSEYSRICHGKRLDPMFKIGVIAELCPELFSVNLNGSFPTKKSSNVQSIPTTQQPSSNQKPSQPTPESPPPSPPRHIPRSVSDRVNSDNFSGFKMPSRKPQNNAQIPRSISTESFKSAESRTELDRQIESRKHTKQWLYNLVRQYKGDKDGGIRMQKVDQLTKESFGASDFEAHCKQQLGYDTKEIFIAHCGPPQLKLAKHKTTGKGKTKSGEWVFQEHDNYPGKNMMEGPHQIPSDLILPDIAKGAPLNIVCDLVRDKVQQFDENNRTWHYCQKTAQNFNNLEITITNMPEKPVFESFQIRLKDDDTKYFEPMSKKLIEFYGDGGPMQNKNARSYKMHPANLRMGLPVVVWLPKYNEWVRCLTVTPTANQRDFTCSLVDYGHKLNVKVDDCCYMDKSFLQWPFLARECKLMGVKPIFGDNFPPKVWEEANTFLFGGHVPGQGNFNIDNPDPNIKLYCKFLELGDERAFVEVSNGNHVDEQTMEPVVIQNHLKKLRLINLDESYVRLNDGHSFDDSVSQKPGQKPVRQVKEHQVYPDNTGDGLRSPGGVSQARGGHRNNGFGRGHPGRNPGSQIGRKPAQKAADGTNLEDYKNRLSAKEKTGVDPLSQVSRSLDDAKYVSMKDAMTSFHQPHSYTSTSRTGHRNTPQTTVGPAEALTRGTLTPPAQMTPANRHTMQNSRQKSNY